MKKLFTMFAVLSLFACGAEEDIAWSESEDVAQIEQAAKKPPPPPSCQDQLTLCYMGCMADCGRQFYDIKCLTPECLVCYADCQSDCDVQIPCP